MSKLFLIAVMLFSLNLSAQELGVVKAVHDGDSYKVHFLSKDTTYWIRLWGADAPEVISNHVTAHQPGGVQSGQFARTYLKNDTVLVEYVSTDEFNRSVCKVFRDSVDVTKYLIENGQAWWYGDKKMPKEYLAELKRLQLEARQSQLGFWGLPGTKFRPSRWRADHKRFSKRKLFIDLW